MNIKLPLQFIFVISVVLILCSTETCAEKSDVDTTKETCDSSHFRCNKTLACIPISWRCDGDDDCNKDEAIVDKSDEENCPPKTCSSDELMCGKNAEATGQCIPQRWACDKEPDCDDGSDEDEAHCGSEAQRTCRSNQFDCGDGMCIPQFWKCDGNSDCDDGSDENDCGESTCPEDDFRCVSDGRCINQIWHCDGDHDCADGSDEVGCPSGCKKGQFNCSDGSMCIEENWRCDGDFDCKDHSDERDCGDNIFDWEGEHAMCSKTDFTCASKDECIHKSWECDGDQDCVDGSDEGPHCNYTKCRDDQFQCDDHYCIPKDLKCNHYPECPDGSDEKNCEPVKCSDKDEFDCYGDGSYCIPASKVCDGRNDCQHREDEESSMCLHTDPCIDFKCSKHSKCVKHYPESATKAEAKCECDPGFTMHEDGYCYDIDECAAGTTCSQICKNFEGGYKCNCFPGYELEHNTFCRAIGEYPWLYYANRRDIRRLRVDSRYMEIIVEKTDNSIALDVDYNSSKIFWTDGAQEKIHSATLKEDVLLAGDQTTVLDLGVRSPDGLAVDWLFKHIYWTDTGLDAISVANYDGSKRRTLVQSNLDDPRAISLDPENGNMYWTDWGQEPKIEMCGMDGEPASRKTIVAQENGLGWPNGLTIDYIGKRIYWIDAKLHKIGTAKMDGTDVKVVLLNRQEISRPFSISVFEDSLYWTDWNTNSIKSVNKFTGRSIQTLSLGSYSVMDIKVVHAMRQERNFADNATALCLAKKCPFLCLPSSKQNSKLMVSCVCENGKELSSDGKSCVEGAVTATTTQKVTTSRPETSRPETTSHKVVVTTGHGYTVVPVENKTSETGPHVKTEGSTGIIAIITAISVAVLLIVLFAVGCLVFRRWNARSRKSMNFDNPVYRKTTTTDDSYLEEEGQIHIPSQMEPLTAKEHV